MTNKYSSSRQSLDLLGGLGARELDDKMRHTHVEKFQASLIFVIPRIIEHRSIELKRLSFSTFLRPLIYPPRPLFEYELRRHERQWEGEEEDKRTKTKKE